MTIKSLDLTNLLSKANSENLSYTQSATELFNISQLSIFELLAQGYTEEQISDMFVDNLDLSGDGSEETTSIAEDLKNFVSNIINLFTSETDEKGSTVEDWSLEDTGELFQDGVSKEEFLTEFDKLLENASDDEYYSEYLKLIEANGAENFFNTLDANQDGKLDQEELDTFINADNKSDSISLTDMSKALQTSDTEAPEEVEEVEEAEESPKESSSSSSTSGSGGGSYSGGSSTKTTPKTIDNMTLEELKAEEKTRATALSDAETSLKDVYSGKDSKVASAQSDADTKKSAYDEALEQDEQISAELKQKKAQNDQDIQKNEQAIAEKNSAIVDKKSAITSKENEISACESAITTLNASLSKLEGQMSEISSDDEDAATKESDISAMIESVKQQISEQESKKSTAESEKAQLESDLETLNSDLSELEVAKDYHEETRTDIEAQIAQTGSVATQEALKSYQDSRSTLEEVKATRIQEATKALETAKSDYQAVTNKITEKENKQLSAKNTYNDGNLFTDDTEAEWEYTQDPETGMKYAVIKPANANPDEELPVVVLLHGSGEGNTEESLKRYYDEMTSQGFNGYIILPQVGASTSVATWGTKAGEGITSILDTFSETHKIDTEHIAVAGYSAGANGNNLGNTINAIDDKYNIVSVGLIAGLPNADVLSDLRSQGIDIYGYTGTNDYYNTLLPSNVSDTKTYSGVFHGNVITSTLSDTDFYKDMLGKYYKF